MMVTFNCVKLFMLRHDCEWQEVKVCREYIKSVSFDYIAKFPLQNEIIDSNHEVIAS